MTDNEAVALESIASSLRELVEFLEAQGAR